MNSKICCIMLVDDDQNDNYYHTREIKKACSGTRIITKNSGIDALKYLESIENSSDGHPDLTFVDINMPCMNGWEFLEKYSQLDKDKQSSLTVVMLSTFINSDEINRTKIWNFVTDYVFKPLTKEKIENIISKHFINI